MFEKLKEWAKANPKLALFVFGFIILVTVNQVFGAEFKGFIAKEGERWFIFEKDGEILHCKNAPGSPNVICDNLAGERFSCENRSPVQGYIGDCKPE